MTDTIVFNQVFDTLTRVKARCNDTGGYATRLDDRSTECKRGIDDYKTGTVRRLAPYEGEKPTWEFIAVPVHALKIRVEYMTHGQLTGRRQMNEISVAVEEQLTGVCAQPPAQKQPLDAELRFGIA